MMMIDDDDFIILHFFMSRTFDKIYYISMDFFYLIAMVTNEADQKLFQGVVIHPGSFVLM